MGRGFPRDRRFYRRMYEARKTLEGISTKLGDETNLENLNRELVGVVSETMQPAHVTLWLRLEPFSKKMSHSEGKGIRLQASGFSNYVL